MDLGSRPMVYPLRIRAEPHPGAVLGTTSFDGTQPHSQHGFIILRKDVTGGAPLSACIGTEGLSALCWQIWKGAGEQRSAVARPYADALKKLGASYMLVGATEPRAQESTMEVRLAEPPASTP